MLIKELTEKNGTTHEKDFESWKYIAGNCKEQNAKCKIKNNNEETGRRLDSNSALDGKAVFRSALCKQSFSIRNLKALKAHESIGKTL